MIEKWVAKIGSTEEVATLSEEASGGTGFEPGAFSSSWLLPVSSAPAG